MSTLISESRKNREKIGIEKKGGDRRSLPRAELRRGGAQAGRQFSGTNATTTPGEAGMGHWRGAVAVTSTAWERRSLAQRGGARARVGERG
jgi:hypothetical protein